MLVVGGHHPLAGEGGEQVGRDGVAQDHRSRREGPIEVLEGLSHPEGIPRPVSRRGAERPPGGGDQSGKEHRGEEESRPDRPPAGTRRRGLGGDCAGVVGGDGRVPEGTRGQGARRSGEKQGEGEPRRQPRREEPEGPEHQVGELLLEDRNQEGVHGEEDHEQDRAGDVEGNQPFAPAAEAGDQGQGIAHQPRPPEMDPEPSGIGDVEPVGEKEHPLDLGVDRVGRGVLLEAIQEVWAEEDAGAGAHDRQRGHRPPPRGSGEERPASQDPVEHGQEDHVHGMDRHRGPGQERGHDEARRARGSERGQRGPGGHPEHGSPHLVRIGRDRDAVPAGTAVPGEHQDPPRSQGPAPGEAGPPEEAVAGQEGEGGGEGGKEPPEVHRVHPGQVGHGGVDGAQQAFPRIEAQVAGAQVEGLGGEEPPAGEDLPEGAHVVGSVGGGAKRGPDPGSRRDEEHHREESGGIPGFAIRGPRNRGRRSAPAASGRGAPGRPGRRSRGRAARGRSARRGSRPGRRRRRRAC